MIKNTSHSELSFFKIASVNLLFKPGLSVTKQQMSWKGLLAQILVKFPSLYYPKGHTYVLAINFVAFLFYLLS